MSCLIHFFCTMAVTSRATDSNSVAQHHGKFWATCHSSRADTTKGAPTAQDPALTKRREVINGGQTRGQACPPPCSQEIWPYDINQPSRHKGTRSASLPYNWKTMSTFLSPIESEFATVEDAEAYDRWFRMKVQASLDDPRPSTPHDQVMRSARASDPLAR
jgi:hypothetical protein